LEDKNVDKIVELLDRRKKAQILKEVYCEIKYTEKSQKQYLISALCGIFLGMLIGISEDTVAIMRAVIDGANGIMLAFVAMILGSYSIFQALLSQDLVQLLIDSKGHLLKDSNKTFLNLTILYIIGICFNFVLSIALKVLPDDFLLVDNVIICNSMAFFGIAAYIGIHILLFLEMINFVINLYRMFNVYNTLKALETLDDCEEEE